MSDTVNGNTDPAVEKPGDTTAQMTQPALTPPAESTKRTTGRLTSKWWPIVAAAAVVVVAGAFFTIGWFTSTRGDDHYFPFLREIGRKMDLQEWGFRQDGPRRDSDRWGWPSCPQRQSEGQRAPQTPSTPQTPSGPQVPSSQQSYLGVRVAAVTPALQQRFALSSTTGALVVGVDDTGPAYQAGIRRGDLITGVDGTVVTTPEDVISTVTNKKPGDRITVTVERDGQSLTFQVTLAAKPAAIS